MTINPNELNFPIILHKEGATLFYIPDLNHYKVEKNEYLPSKLPVFFNPIMEFRRDISILAIKTYKSQNKQNITFCDPLTATGAMGIRVAKEVGDITVYINDISKNAIALAKKSVKYNKLENIIVSNDYANDFMVVYAKKIKRFHIIDIDPFGTPVPFLASALYSIRGDGLILCTATDMLPLVGIKKHLQSCIRNYGSVPLKTEYAHEIALRILIGYIVREAAKYNHAARILFSHSSNHYIQVFIKLIHGILLANEVLSDIGFIGHCFKCENRFIYPGITHEFSNICEICGNSLKFAGPLWLGNLSDEDFCRQMLKNLSDLELRTKKRIQRTIDSIILENNRIVTYHDLHKICKKENLNVPPIEKVIQSLIRNNFTVSRTHFSPITIRTDAKRERIIKIIEDLQPK